MSVALVVRRDRSTVKAADRMFDQDPLVMATYFATEDSDAQICDRQLKPAVCTIDGNLDGDEGDGMRRIAYSQLLARHVGGFEHSIYRDNPPDALVDEFNKLTIDVEDE